MTGCNKWKGELFNVALGQRASSALEQHLASCAGCREVLASLRERSGQMDAGLRALVNAEEPSPAFRGRLMQSIEARRSSEFHWRGPVRVLAAGAALAALVFAFAISVDHRSGTRDFLTSRSNSAAISDWRSPTDALLRTSAAEFLTTSPRLGETYFPMGSARTPAGPGDRPENRRKNP
jgi:hypothetical protein